MRRILMNILEAKNQIKNTVKMYLHKDAQGHYLVPSRRQRPVFLLGPPGIGKTEIVAQISSEMDIGFVNYTITHHTRQSAIGLPTIESKDYGESSYNITSYTLSEIIASVYEAIELQSQTEGILFIDEINCVSESLAPAMLDLLQNKKFGPHKIPEGWILVSAGNPTEFNKSAREFDMVTLDRLKKIEVMTDYDVWKKYAYKNLFSEDVLAYLTHREKYLFHAEKTPNGLLFVTPRAWEDLSQALIIYQQLKIEVTFDLIVQYIQFEDIAREFYRYFLLYRKYKKDYNVSEIIEGKYKDHIAKFKNAEFDEKFAIIEVLISALNQKSAQALEGKQIINQLKQIYINVKRLNSLDAISKEIERLNINSKSSDFNSLLIRQNRQIIQHLHEWLELNQLPSIEKRLNDYEKIIELQFEGTAENIKHTLEFVKEAFGEGQELVALMVNLLSSIHVMRFVSIKRVTEFYDYNSRLLIENNHKEILEEIEQLNKLD